MSNQKNESSNRSRFQLLITDPDDSERPPEDLPIGTRILGEFHPAFGDEGVLHFKRREVASRHARITCMGNSCQIEDMGSRAGTFVNGQKLTPYEPIPLYAGDLIRIDVYELILQERRPEEWDSASLSSGRLTQVDPLASPMDNSTKRTETEKGLPSRYLIQLLPPIYRSNATRSSGDASNFLAYFLGMIEVELMPLMWSANHIDLHFDPATAPLTVLSWLANLLGVAWESPLAEEQRRDLIRRAPSLYAWRGTRRGLEEILTIYAQCKVEVQDQDLEPFHFDVSVHGSEELRPLLAKMIEQYKPAHTTMRHLHFLTHS